MARDYYDTLGVSRTADQKQIRQAYRKLARKLHPDVNPGDKNAEARFKEVNAANEVLSDPEKRKKYDRYGDRWQYADQIEDAQRQARSRGRPGGGQSYTYDFSGAPSGRGGQSGAFARPMQAVGHVVLVTVNGLLPRRPTARAFARHVHVGLQPHVHEIVHSIVLQDGFGRTEDFRLALKVSPIESGGQLGQFLFRHLETFLTALAISLALLTGIKPIERIVPLLGEVAPREKVERLGGAGVIGFGSPPEQGLGNGSGPELIVETAHFDQVVG